MAASPATLAPQVVEIPSGKLRLKALLWKPPGAGPFPAVLFNHGSGGADPARTAGLEMTEAAKALAPLFVKHGYAFLYPFRRRQGLSADQAPFMQDLLKQEEAVRGKESRQHLQFKLLTIDHFDDAMAALSYLKAQPEVDRRRIAVVGHSFGGQLALLISGCDSTIRAVVTFAAAAGSWDRSPELRERLLASIRKTNAAIMLVQAENDYSIAPGRDIAAELARLHKPHAQKIYPPVGRTAEDGHNALYEAIPEWSDAVFRFLDRYLRTGGCHGLEGQLNPRARGNSE